MKKILLMTTVLMAFGVIAQQSIGSFQDYHYGKKFTWYCDTESLVDFMTQEVTEDIAKTHPYISLEKNGRQCVVNFHENAPEEANYGKATTYKINMPGVDSPYKK